jgi:hypothetical protein
MWGRGRGWGDEVYNHIWQTKGGGIGAPGQIKSKRVLTKNLEGRGQHYNSIFLMPRVNICDIR